MGALSHMVEIISNILGMTPLNVFTLFNLIFESFDQ